jgi:pimeloyl-ACP methyl ester carboxylesterase
MRKLLIVLLLFCSTFGSTHAQTIEAIEETISILRVDASVFNIFVSRPRNNRKIPIVLFIDGSGCYSAKWESGGPRLFVLPEAARANFASVIVEKPGLTIGQPPPKPGPDQKCPDEFLKHYSIDTRTNDHLRTLQHLRKYAADWWNGDVLVYGYSDGGMIGAQLASATPEVKRAVLGGMGGGIAMAKLFEDYMICKPNEKDVAVRESCLADLRLQFNEMRDNPTSKKTWSGPDNSYKVWATRLDALEYILIRDLTIPFLIVHGELDQVSTPVESARALVDQLKKHGVKDFTYWEIPGIKHAFSSLPLDRALGVGQATVNWLLGIPFDKYGPPNFDKDWHSSPVTK